MGNGTKKSVKIFTFLTLVFISPSFPFFCTKFYIVYFVFEKKKLA